MLEIAITMAATPTRTFSENLSRIEFNQNSISLHVPTQQELATVIGNNLNDEQTAFANSPHGMVIATMIMNSWFGLQTHIEAYIHNNNTLLLNYVDATADALYSCIPGDKKFDDLKNEITTRCDDLRALITTQGTLITNVATQVGNLPASAGQSGGGPRQPKIGEPPKFSGADKKSTDLQDWVAQLGVWFAHEGIVTDKQKIVTALSRLEGAQKYMGSYYELVEQGAYTGTWENFKHELRAIYGQRDDKEGAKKELTTLFENKNLAHHDFIKYAEKFRTLGRLSGYDSALLIEKLRLVITQDLRMCLIGVGANIPTIWTSFLDLLLEYYKALHPEKAQGSIFGSGHKGDTSVPMEVDRAEKKKGKGKGKEVNSAEKSNKFYAIHKKHGHTTEECRLNSKASKPEQKHEKKENQHKPPFSKGKALTVTTTFKGKRVRIVEVETDTSDEERETPPPASSSKELNTLRVASTAKIEELPEKDEIQDLSKRGKPFDPADFLRRYL